MRYDGLRSSIERNGFPHLCLRSTIEDLEAEAQWDKAEEEMGSPKWEEEEEPQTTKTETKAKADSRKNKEKDMTPKRHLIHKCGYAVSLLVTFAAFCMAVAQIVSIIFADVGVVQIVLRLYVILACSLVILTELELTKFARESYILHQWITRGLLYNFIGVIGLEELETSEIVSNIGGVNPAQIYIKIISWVMVVVGCFYFLMGVFCIQSRYENQRTDYAERVAKSVLDKKEEAGVAAAADEQA